MEERGKGNVISPQQWVSKPTFGLVTSNEQPFLQCCFCERLSLEEDSATKSMSESPSATTQLPLWTRRPSVTRPCLGLSLSLTNPSLAWSYHVPTPRMLCPHLLLDNSSLYVLFVGEGLLLETPPDPILPLAVLGDTQRNVL